MPEIDLTTIQQGDVDPKVLEVYKILKRFLENPDRRWWEKDIYEKGWKAVRESEIWDDKDKKAMQEKDQVPLNLNNLSKGVQGSVAVVAAKKPGVICKPIGSSDLYVAELFQRGISYVWDQNRGTRVVQNFIEDCKIGGMGRIDAKFDDSKGIYGKIVFTDEHPDTVYWDNKGKLSESHILKAHLVSKSYAKEAYEDVTDEDLAYKGPEKETTKNVPDGKTGQDNYAVPDSGPKPTVANIEDEPEDIWEIEAWLYKKKREYWVISGDPAQPEAIKKEIFETKGEAEGAIKAYAAQGAVAQLWPRVVEKRIQRIIIGKKLVSEEENPYGIDADGAPVMGCVLLPHDRTLRGMPTCPTFRAMELQKERNKRRMQAIYVVSKQTDAPITTVQGYKWVKDAKHGDMLITEKGIPYPPSRLAPGVSAAELLLLEKEAKTDIDDEYDTTDVMRGKMPPGDPSGRVVLALQDSGGMMSLPFSGSVEDALTSLIKVIVALMLRHWQPFMWKRLIEEDEWGTWQPDKEQQIDDSGRPIQPPPDVIQMKWQRALDLIANEGMNLIDLDVKVMAGSTMPTNRMAKQAVAMDMMKIGAYDAQAVLESIDDPKAEVVAQRIQKQREMEMQAAMAKGAGK